MTGTNTYEFGTSISEGTLAVEADANLGSTGFTGKFVTLSGGVLKFLRGFSSNRTVTLSSTSTIDTGANDVTLTGPVRGAGRLIKTGTGTLTLAGDVTFTGGTTVLGGQVVVTGLH